jgi:hypothetical protein
LQNNIDFLLFLMGAQKGVAIARGRDIQPNATLERFRSFFRIETKSGNSFKL